MRRSPARGGHICLIKKNQLFFNRFNMILDVLIAFVSMLMGYYIRFHWLPDAHEVYTPAYYVTLAVLSGLLHAIVYNVVGLYASNRNLRIQKTLLRILFSEVFCTLLLLSSFYAFGFKDVSRISIGFAAFLCWMLSSAKHLVVRVILRHYRSRGYNLKNVILIGRGKTAENYLAMIRAHAELGYRLTGYYSPEPSLAKARWLGGYENVAATIRSFACDEVVLALPAEDYTQMCALIGTCDKEGLYIHIIPCYDEYTSSKMGVETVEGINILDIRVIPLSNAGNAMAKRTLDLLCAVLLCILTLPIMLIAAVGIKLTSPGPIFFRQQRVGKNKKTFDMWKLRTMRVADPEEIAENPGWQDRRTTFGSFLRKYSIDELPQIFNVLKGQMSFVGPRPEIPFYVEQFVDEIPLYMIKHHVKPGLTGWAQVNGYRGDTSIKRRVELDIYYIENWTLLFDLKIMLLTLFRLQNNEELVRADEKDKRDARKLDA